VHLFKLIFISYIKEIIMTHTQLSQLVQALLDAPKSNPTVKEFAQSWFDAEGTEKQAELTKQLVSVAEQNIALIDEVIDYARSERAIQSLGEEGAANLLQHAKDIKAEGAEFCDCAACVAAKNIIDLKAEIA
jgi:signal transduction histidine kinase